MQRKHLIMLAVSLGFFFVTATTFTSLGLVLYSMVAELHWSQAAAGFSFSLLGLACGLTSPLPPLCMKWLGSRWTLFGGAMVLAAGFGLAALVHGIGSFFLATCLMGAGFSLIAPAPAIYLLANWFPATAPRMIGYYFMAGALGGVAGPPLVAAIVGLSGSWRVHWAVMAAASVVVGAIALVCVRDTGRIRDADVVRNAGTPAQPADAGGTSVWTVREALASRQFLLIALALTVIQTVVTTIHSVLVTHVATLGAGSTYGALAMSLVALSGTLSKGVAGRLAERHDPRGLLLFGIMLQCAAFVLLGLGSHPAPAFVFALLFGIGWGVSWLSGHVLLLRYFGSRIAGSVVAMATMATTVAVLGPYCAGLVYDRSHSFSMVFLVYAGLLALVAAITALGLSAPAVRRQLTDDRDEAPARLLGVSD
ncbi:MAG: MFS transporter [Pseudomonas sp.]